MNGQHHAGGFDLAHKLQASMESIPGELLGVFGETAMPIGCVVCTARLDAAFQLGEPAEGTAAPAARVVRRLTGRQMPECFTVRYDDFGDYAPGRWAWLLSDVTPLTPPPAAIGRQGFFDLPPGFCRSMSRPALPRAAALIRRVRYPRRAVAPRAAGRVDAAGVLGRAGVDAGQSLDEALKKRAT